MSAFVLTAIISVSSASFTRLTTVWDSTRDFQLASQELSNHLERLTLLSKEECTKQLESLTVSSPVQEAMPGCWLHGELKEDKDTARIVLSLHSKNSMRNQPIVLVGWLDAGVMQ
ncbi:MAG: hypothetical protein ABL921_26845 [Pirellula sp.]